jgi:hypothetical protein
MKSLMSQVGTKSSQEFLNAIFSLGYHDVTSQNTITLELEITKPLIIMFPGILVVLK